MWFTCVGKGGGERDSTGGWGGWEGNCVTTCQGFVPGRQSSGQEKVPYIGLKKITGITIYNFPTIIFYW